MRHHLIQSSSRSWQDMFREATDLGTKLGPGRLVAISHASDSSSGTVTVWFRDGDPGPRRWLRVRFVRSSMRSWQSLFQETAKWADGLADGQLFSISHSCDNTDAVVAVWYWVDHDPADRRLAGSVSLPPGLPGSLSEPDDR